MSNQWHPSTDPVDPCLAVAFEDRLRAAPDALALVIGERTWTRAELNELGERATGSLQALGVGPGSFVVTQYDTSAEDLAVALAVSRLGATLVPVPATLGGYEVDYILELVAPSAFIVRDAESATRFTVPEGVSILTGEQVVGGEASAPAIHPVDADHLAVVGFTSGSTGRPKGVVHRASSLHWSAGFAASIAGVKDGEAIGMIGAGAGAPGYAFFSYLGLTRGATIVRGARWEPLEVLDLWSKHGVVWTMVVPTMLQMLVGAAEAAPQPPDLSRLRAATLGGSFISPDLIRRARRVLGVEVLRMYAMSECMGVCSMQLTDDEADRDELDGRPGPEGGVAVLDDDGNELPPGAEGELALRGPSQLAGYLGDDETLARLRTADGWFRTGDLGRVDERGYVKVVGRKKDMIIRGGLNIDPSEVENLVLQHPDVADVAVVAYPDERLGERCCAVIRPRRDVVPDVPSLAAFLRERGLSTAKLPERVVVCRTFPTSPDGKVAKAELRRLVSEDLDRTAIP